MPNVTSLFLRVFSASLVLSAATRGGASVTLEACGISWGKCRPLACCLSSCLSNPLKGQKSTEQMDLILIDLFSCQKWNALPVSCGNASSVSPTGRFAHNRAFWNSAMYVRALSRNFAFVSYNTRSWVW